MVERIKIVPQGDHVGIVRKNHIDQVKGIHPVVCWR